MRSSFVFAALVASIAACRGGTTPAPASTPSSPPAPPARAASPPPCRGPTRGDAVAFGDARAEVRVVDPGACLRTYRLSTTAKLRAGVPENPRIGRRASSTPTLSPSESIVVEREGAPRVRSGHAMFDALHALALEEARQASVASIRDDAFDEGRPLPCAASGCFETGRLWTYVWTRDTAYSVDLGLAMLDPARARSSLEFKLSERRGGGHVEIVQDTGSGGSWPVSTDRVAWALGASKLLLALDGPARTAFRDRAFDAIRNTVERDRLVVWDPADGLYRGEQSFLDWRAQTYPPWTATDTLDVGLSKALSTNVVHYAALRTAADLARERGERGLADRYGAWADALRVSIRKRLWLEERGLFSTYVPSFFDPAPTSRFDLLGHALAVLTGVADDREAASILRSYPDTGAGPPVVWPEQKGVPIYHNRATWPFVTAYWMLAARRANDDAVADRCVASLLGGAATNLSNMENLELLSGKAWVDEGPLSGPVVDSQRQLWSIAGYLAMVYDGVFGRDVGPEGIRFLPYVTRGMHRAYFDGAESIRLEDLAWKGKKISVVVHLPPLAGEGGAYRVASVRVGGKELGRAFVPADALAKEATFDVTLAADGAPPGRRNAVAPEPRAIDAPSTPSLRVERAPRGLRLRIDPAGEPAASIVFTIHRDGQKVARALPGTTREWVDADVDVAKTSPCYVVESVDVASGNASYHSAPACFWGARGERARTLARFDDVRADVTGEHAIQIVGSNPGDVTTGVTAAVARLTVESLPDAKTVAQGYVFMPHTGPAGHAGASSFVVARLEAGRHYRVRIDHDDVAVNMSAFEHFARYTRGRGGRGGAENTMKVDGVRIYARTIE